MPEHPAEDPALHAAPAVPVVPADPARSAGITRWRAALVRAKGPVMAAAALGAVLSGFAGYWTTYRTVATAAAAAPAKTSTVTTVAPLSILVLPFANQTGDATKSYIADSLTTSIAGDLTRIREVFVVPSTTAFAYKDKRLTIQQVGENAGVRFVLSGSVMASGDRLRITAELADSETGAELWNETFEGNAGDLFALQDQVTTRVGNSIGNRMVIAAATASERHRSPAKVADILMRARATNLKPQSVKNFEEAEALYRTAISEEPGNLNALGGLAATLARHATWLSASDPERKKKLSEAYNLAMRVREVEPENARILLPLEIIAMENNDFEAVKRIDEERVLREPKSPAALNNLAYLYRLVGEPEKAIPLLHKALSLYPKGDDSLFDNLGSAYLAVGNDDAAIMWLSKAMDMGSQLPDACANLAIAYSNKGDLAKARQYVATFKSIAATTGYRGIDSDPLSSQAPEAMKTYYYGRYVAEWKKAGLP